MQNTIINMIVTIAVYVIGAAAVVYGYSYVNRKVQEGIARELAENRDHVGSVRA